MSLFLGKIHYFMYDKIKWFEAIESEVKNFIEDKKLPLGDWEKEVYTKFSKPCDEKPLEEVIDQSNIHGWLSDKIDNAEGRLAIYVTKLLSENKDYKVELEKLLYERGRIQGDSKGKTIQVNNPQDILNAMNEFILEGMPCDNALQVLDENEDSITWTLTTDLHKKFYDAVNGNVEEFHMLRDAWKKGFTETIAQGYEYKRIESNREEIIKIK